MPILLAHILGPVFLLIAGPLMIVSFILKPESRPKSLDVMGLLVLITSPFVAIYSGYITNWIIGCNVLCALVAISNALSNYGKVLRSYEVNMAYQFLLYIIFFAGLNLSIYLGIKYDDLKIGILAFIVTLLITGYIADKTN